MIVIPMAGMSSRFAKAGYSTPKYMLPLGRKTVFDHAVGSFDSLFHSESFLFIARDVPGISRFIEDHCQILGISRCETVILDGPTQGQAHTVAIGIDAVQASPGDPLTVFNIDTFRPGFRYPEASLVADGYLEVFLGEGAGWSFVLPQRPGSEKVAYTTEKKPISQYCCTGLYYFAKIDDFLRAFEAQLHLPTSQRQAGELYVAPLYNELISAGLDIRMHLIPADDVIFCGVPGEYEQLLRERYGCST